MNNIARCLLVAFPLVLHFSDSAGGQDTSSEWQDIYAAKAAIQDYLKDKEFTSQDHRRKVEAAELAISRLAAAHTFQATSTLVKLTDYKLDGGLSEDLTCAIADHRKTAIAALSRLSGAKVWSECVKDFGGDAGIAKQYCHAPEEASKLLSELREMLTAKRQCE